MVIGLPEVRGEGLNVVAAAAVVVVAAVALVTGDSLTLLAVEGRW